jgi:ABC-type glycerol-3-phosphate transport system substrate-binding protein
MYTISILTSTTVNPILDKQEIVLAGLDIVDDGTVQALVYRFNNTHDDYRIVLRDYSDEISDELTWQQMIPEIRRIMLLDLFSGNSPNIYIDIDSNLSLTDYSNTDYLLDLGPFIEDSQWLTEDYYMMNVLLNGREGQGVYYIPTCFSVNCLSGSSEVIQGRESWTIKEFDTMVAELPTGIHVQSELTKDYLLFWALSSSLDEYVDFESLQANFVEDDFVAMLEWINEYGVDEASFSKSDALHFEYIGSVYSILANYSFYGQMREYIGFPSNNSAGLAYYPRYNFAISSQSEEPSVCWEIISDALSEEFQTDHIFYENPVNRNAVQNNIDRILIEEKEQGSTSFSEEELTNISRVYWDVLERTDQMLINSDMIAMVVSEEAAAYFAGQKSADEVAALIQNRVQNMLDERM